MSWKDILKNVSERERLDAEEFASDEMGQWRDEKTRLNDELGIEKHKRKFQFIREWIEDNKNSTDKDIQDAIKVFEINMKHAEKNNDLKIYQKAWGAIVLFSKQLDDYPLRSGPIRRGR